jgi:SAM-dependent methyltransferase
LDSDVTSRRFTGDPRRNAETLYVDQNPDAGVSAAILDFVRQRAGQRILDFGCGTGGYAARLQQVGFDVTAVDRNREYVASAARLGVTAQHVNGSLPFADRSFDTLIMIEVLEHLDDEIIERVLTDVRRVVRKNVLITVPDCEDIDRLHVAAVAPDHVLATDHAQFFTERELRALLTRFFPSVEIRRGDPILPHLLMPAAVRRPLSALYRLGLLRPTLYSRLYAEARVDG